MDKRIVSIQILVENKTYELLDNTNSINSKGKHWDNFINKVRSFRKSRFDQIQTTYIVTNKDFKLHYDLKNKRMSALYFNKEYANNIFLKDNCDKKCTLQEVINKMKILDIHRLDRANSYNNIIFYTGVKKEEAYDYLLVITC